MHVCSTADCCPLLSIVVDCCFVSTDYRFKCSKVICNTSLQRTSWWVSLCTSRQDFESDRASSHRQLVKSWSWWWKQSARIEGRRKRVWRRKRGCWGDRRLVNVLWQMLSHSHQKKADLVSLIVTLYKYYIQVKRIQMFRRQFWSFSSVERVMLRWDTFSVMFWWRAVLVWKGNKPFEIRERNLQAL